jgi:hypothetical protein
LKDVQKESTTIRKIKTRKKENEEENWEKNRKNMDNDIVAFDLCSNVCG